MKPEIQTSASHLFILLLILLLGTLNRQVASGGVSNYTKDLVPYVHSGSEYYGTAIRTSDMNSVAPLTFFTKWQQPYNKTKDFQILGSSVLIDVRQCDTNCFVFSTADEMNMYLIVAYLSPKFYLDTIFSTTSQSPNNWLKLLSDIDFSLRDSIFSGRFYDPLRGPFEIKKLVQKDSVVSIRTIKNVFRQSMSFDYKRIYFDYHAAPLAISGDTMYIIAYDIAHDSLFRLPTFTENAWRASSRLSTGSVFYLGGSKDNTDLWELKRDGSSAQLTNISPVERIFHYELFWDHVSVDIGPKQESQATRAIQIKNSN